MRKSVITAGCALTALLCAVRIFLLLLREGSVYTMGIFPMALLFGLFCLWKKALFYDKVFFSVPIRLMTAMGFTALQTLGLYWSHPQIADALEVCVWTIGFTPLTFAGQNMLFAISRKLAEGRDNCSEKITKASNNGGWGCFACAFAVIFTGFCIPFATYYPAIMAYDVIPQLDQIRISGLTTHHPLIHTLYLAACLEFVGGV